MGDRIKTAIVIGGGPAGIEAALGIAHAGYRAVLVEKEPETGGNPQPAPQQLPTLGKPTGPPGL